MSQSRSHFLRQVNGRLQTGHFLVGKSDFRLIFIGKKPFVRTLSFVGMKSSQKVAALSEVDIDRIIEMAWEDRTPFDAIEAQFGLTEQEVIAVMRREMKPSSWRMWRERVQGRATKHAAFSAVDNARFKANRQRAVTLNKITKR